MDENLNTNKKEEENMNYYVMTCEGTYPIAAIEEEPHLPGGPWISGMKVKIEVEEPLRYTLNSKRLGNVKAMYTAESIPIMNNDLVHALKDVGVTNIEFFDAIIHNPKTGKVHKNYKAFNIIGLVLAADMEKSTLMEIFDTKMFNVYFDGLVIDKKKASPFLLFRLAEKMSAIIVNEKVKKIIEKRNIPGMIFYGPGDWSG